MTKQNYRHLPLKNAYNVRDLGGYPCKSGNKITNYHSFLRADDLHYLDDEDINLLIEYGLTAVIDLRSVEEVGEYPDPFEKRGDIHYANIPLITENIADITRSSMQQIVNNDADASQPTSSSNDKSKLNGSDADIPQLGDMMPLFYMALLTDSTQAVKKIFEFLAEQEGVVLFHCTAGKDRTGITAMLLLMLAGVDDADIIADYSVTYIYNSANPLMQKIMSEYPIEFLLSNTDYIMPAIKYIREEYKTAEQYLEHIGIEIDVINKVIDKLCR